MKISITLFFLFFVLVSCSPQSKSSDYQGQVLQFQFDTKFEDGIVARWGDIQLSGAEVFESSAVLKDIEVRIQKIIFQQAYSQALNLVTQKDHEIPLIFGFPEFTKDIKKELNISQHPGVTISYQPGAPFVYQLNQQSIQWEQIETWGMELSLLQEELYKEKLHLLESHLIRQWLVAQVKASQLSYDQFIEQKITGSVQAPSSEELKKFAEEKGFKGSEFNKEIEQQLQNLWISQLKEKKISQFAHQNLKNKNVQISFKKPQTLFYISPLKSGPQIGEGPISIYLASHNTTESAVDLNTQVIDLVKSSPKAFRLHFLPIFEIRDQDSFKGFVQALCDQRKNKNSVWDFLSSSVQNSKSKLTPDCQVMQEATRFEVSALLNQSQKNGFHKDPVVILEKQIFKSKSSDDIIHAAKCLKLKKGLGFNLFFRLKTALFGPACY